MKTFKDYCNEVAKEKGLPYPWESSVDHDPMGDFWWGFEVFEEASKRYTTASIKEHLSRVAENVSAISTKFLVESRELQEQPGSEYGKTLLEGQIIGSLSVGQAIFESITNIDIQLS